MGSGLISAKKMMSRGVFMKNKISAKAQGKEERSSSIVVSFGSKWLERMASGGVSAVIRKRGPVSGFPSLMYIHVNSPVGGICAKAKINSVNRVALDDAQKLSCEIGLSDKEISDYSSGGTEVFCYRISDLIFLKEPIRSSDINKDFVYYPPQSFFFLSKAADDFLSRLFG